MIPSEQLLNNHAAETFRDYNTEQMIQVLPPQNKHQVCLIWGCSTLFLAITSILFYNLKKKKKVIFCTLMSSGNFGWNDRTMYNRMHAYFHFITPHSSFTHPPLISTYLTLAWPPQHILTSLSIIGFDHQTRWGWWEWVFGPPWQPSDCLWSHPPGGHLYSLRWWWAWVWCGAFQVCYTVIMWINILFFLCIWGFSHMHTGREKKTFFSWWDEMRS